MKARLLTLGPPLCLLDDRELTEFVAQKNRFALLVYLAVERDVSRDQAANMFWPESDDDRAKHALSQSLYELKRVLGDDWLETPAGRLVVNDNLTCDAHQLSAFLDVGSYDKAITLYRGPFLDGFYLSNCKPFEVWVDKQRAHHERAHRKARREYVDRLLQDRRVTEAVTSLRRWVDLEPLEDEANHKLIEVLAAHGSRTEALNAYSVYEQRLKEELEIEPLDHTKELVKSLRTDQRWSSLPRPDPETAAQQRRRNRLWIPAVLMTATVLLTLYLVPRRNGAVPWNPQLDTTHFAILPFTYAENVKERLYEDQLLRTAMAKWRGVNVVAEFQVQAAVDRLHRKIGVREGETVARQVNAGRFLLGSVTKFADTLLIHIAMYDGNGRDAPLADAIGHIPLSLKGADSVFSSLVVDLLFDKDAASKSSGADPPATHSWPARRAFERGQEAVQSWQLAAADSAFTEATQLDGGFVESFVWLALVRFWNGGDNASMSFLAGHAIADSARIDARSTARAHGVLQFARGDVEGACATFRRLAHESSDDFADWYSLGKCLQKDRAVVHESGPPAGLKFRASYQEAMDAYQRAFRIHPNALRAFRENAFLSARELFYTARRQLRTGLGSGADSGMYASYARKKGDSVYFTPVPAQDLRGRSERPDEIRAAVQLQRQTFREVASGWRAVDPNSSAAAEAVAISMEMLGDPRMTDTLTVAERLASNDQDRARIRTYRILSSLKYALPDDLSQIKKLGESLDSILKTGASNSSDPLSVSSVALIRGRITDALSWADNAAQQAASRTGATTGLLESSAMRMEILSALGASPGAIRRAQGEFEAILKATQPETQNNYRPTILRSELMSWPYTVPSFRSTWLMEMRHPLLAIQSFAERGMTRPVMDSLRAMQALRHAALVDPVDLTFDVLVAEAQLWSVIGKRDDALAVLLPSLNSFAQRPPRNLSDPVQTAALLRAMVFAAEIAHTLHDDATARRWARPLLALWSGADPMLQPTLRRMQMIASTK